MQQNTENIILESLRRIETGLGDVREQLAGLKSWRDTAWPAMQSLQDSQERRLDRLEQDRAAKAEVEALEVRVRANEEFRSRAGVYLGGIATVAAAAVSLALRFFLGA